MIETITHTPDWFPKWGLSKIFGIVFVQFLFFTLCYFALYYPLIWIALFVYAMMNDYEPYPPDWYFTNHHPDKPALVVFLLWYCRNPFHNLGRYILGFSTYGYEVIGISPDTTYPREHADGAGLPYKHLPAWKWHFLKLNSFIYLPFISLYSEAFKFYIGWQHNGFFGMKMGFRSSKINLW